MTKPEFVYVTYIRTTAEDLWRALTEPAFTRRYWGIAHETDWQPGSPMIWESRDRANHSDPEQVVLEADPYRRLAYTWHAFTPEWNTTVGLSDEVLATVAALTVVHDNFEPQSTMAKMVSNGWPMVLSSLKTLLETGAAQPVLV
jgi:uncharacterized protein YndB with AHSA1/START domain